MNTSADSCDDTAVLQKGLGFNVFSHILIPMSNFTSSRSVNFQIFMIL
jgi:hypothetical protein